VIGDFYVQFAGASCAYDLPGGAIAMCFTGGGFTSSSPDGLGGQFLDGTFEMRVVEATRKFRPLVGGHNHINSGAARSVATVWAGVWSERGAADGRGAPVTAARLG
jgi:hypothetical protein